MAEIPESHRDLLDAQTLSLATIDPAGRPQVTTVWFLAENGVPRLSLNTARRKVVNLRRNPACSICIVDPGNVYRYLEIRGDAEIEPDDDYAFADRLGAKYGADVRTMDKPGETRVVVTVRPARIRAVHIGG